jgi:predicted MFS family arabinose efflux permease
MVSREAEAAEATESAVAMRHDDPPVWTVMLAGACAFLTLYATQPILPLLAGVFQANKAAVSLTVFASTMGVALAAPFMGLLADRLGRRKIIISSALALGLTSVLVASSGNLTQLIFWRFIQGVCTPGVFVITITCINEEWNPRKAGSAMAAYVSGTVLGGFFGRFTSSFVTEHADWRMGFVALGVTGLVMTAAMWCWMPTERESGRSQALGSQFGAAARHLRNRALLARYAVGFCVLFTLVSTFSYVTFYLAAPPFELSPVMLGMIFLVYLVGAAVTPVVGRWIDERGSQSTLQRAALLGMLGILLSIDAKLWAVVTGLAIVSTGVFIAQAAVTRSLGQCTKQDQPLAVGLYASFYYLGEAWVQLYQRMRETSAVGTHAYILYCWLKLPL